MLSIESSREISTLKTIGLEASFKFLSNALKSAFWHYWLSLPILWLEFMLLKSASLIENSCQDRKISLMNLGALKKIQVFFHHLSFILLSNINSNDLIVVLNNQLLFLYLGYLCWDLQLQDPYHLNLMPDLKQG